jgi:hypothetical protein
MMSWNHSRHLDLKDAFKISRVDLQIFRGAMSHSMSLSLDLTYHLLAAQRDIHYLRTQLTDIEDTLCAH